MVRVGSFAVDGRESETVFVYFLCWVGGATWAATTKNELCETRLKIPSHLIRSCKQLRG